MWLHRIRAAIATAEEREQNVVRSKQRAPDPDWVLTRGLDAQRSPIEVHVGGGRMQGKHTRAVSRQQAIEALERGLRACMHCRPDTALGIDS